MVLYSMHDGHLLQCALIGSIGRTTLPDCDDRSRCFRSLSAGFTVKWTTNGRDVVLHDEVELGISSHWIAVLIYLYSWDPTYYGSNKPRCFKKAFYRKL